MCKVLGYTASLGRKKAGEQRSQMQGQKPGLHELKNDMWKLRSKDAKPGKPGTETMELEPEYIHKVQPNGLQVASNKVKGWQE